jgi:hypothetical protein
MMRAGARLHPNQRRRLLRKEPLYLTAPQLTPQHHGSGCIHTVNLEHVLR